MAVITNTQVVSNVLIFYAMCAQISSSRTYNLYAFVFTDIFQKMLRIFILLKVPAHSGSSFYNYKGQHSIVLMALVSADYKFLMVDIGAQGRHSDGGIFKNTEISHRFNEGLMNLPPPSIIDPAHTQLLPFVIVADEAFQLNSFTMRPYPGRNITAERRIFNYRLSRARRVVENAFGIMAARWRIYQKPMNTSLATTEAIVQATICLHNFMMTRDRYCDDSFADRVNHNNNIVANGAWRENIPVIGAIQNYRDAGSNKCSRQAAEIRDRFTKYFMTEGAVPWQWEMS